MGLSLVPCGQALGQQEALWMSVQSPWTRPLSSQSEPEMAPLGTSCSELACELSQEALFESRTIPFQVYEHPYLMGAGGAEAFPGNEGVFV